MKISDVKTLWGRAANRCSFPECRIELTTKGDATLLGEMAHIIAETSNGPRGNTSISKDQLDEYPNRILLCPTHHTEIDKNPGKWTVEKLKKIKQEHERWVSDQLERGKISIYNIDNSAFITSRKVELSNFCKEGVWIVTFITPLDISEDIIDPLNEKILDKLNGFSLPERACYFTSVQTTHTRPNANGIINEDLSRLSDGMGHLIQIFRNGHCEFLVRINSHKVNGEKIEPVHGEMLEDRKGEQDVLFYTDIAACFKTQIENLKDIWDSCLPFNDMLLTTLIKNTHSTRLYSYETTFRRYLTGHKIKSHKLEYSNVINREIKPLALTELVLKRFVNNFGLVLREVFDGDKFINPKLLFDV